MAAVNRVTACAVSCDNLALRVGFLVSQISVSGVGVVSYAGSLLCLRFTRLRSRFPTFLVCVGVIEIYLAFKSRLGTEGK